MAKVLLVDYCAFDITPTQLHEATSRSDGRMVVSGVLQRANAKNQNGRVYPKNILMREAAQYAKIQIAERRALGELDHPDSSVVNLSNASHNVLGIKWNGDDLIGEVEVLCDRQSQNGTIPGTPAGNILKSLLSNGVKLGISSRGMGSVEQLSEDTVEVQDDFELICWDFVSNPSTHGAFMSPGGVHEGLIKEGVENKIHINEYGKINRIITDIICEVKGVCPCIPGGKY